MFDPANKSHLTQGYDLYKQRNDDFYTSGTWQNAKTRYETRRDCYYRKYSTSQPIWRNQLYFPVFFMACKAFESAVKSTIQAPLVNIIYKSNTAINPQLAEMQKLQNYDLQRDLYVGNFERTLFSMYWFNQLFGVSVARETMAAERVVQNQKRVVMDRMGGERITEEERVKLKEYTRTDLVHPLNFAHPLNRGDFYQSEWGSVRYELSISDIYAMLNHPMANKPGIKKVISEIEKGNVGWSSKDTTFYCDSEDYRSGKLQQNTIIANECSGDMQFKGNYGDNALYWGIYAEQYQEWLLIGSSQYGRHPFWKMRCHPDPMAPYGVGPQDVLIPYNLLRNKLFNQYLDWTDSNLKFMYQAFPGFIRGGLRSIIDNPAGGILEAIDEESWKRSGGELIRPVNKDKSGIPGMADVFNTLEKGEIEGSVASSRKSAVQGITKTATGEMQVAEQQNQLLESITRDMDHGLVDAMWQKMYNRRKYVTEREVADMGENQPSILYYPFELGDEDSDIEVNRIEPTAEANKYMAFLGKVTEAITAVSQVQQIDVGAVIEQYDKIGRQLGIEGIDGMLRDPSLAPQVGAAPGGQPPAMPPGALQGAPQPQGAPVAPEGAGNGLALA